MSGGSDLGVSPQSGASPDAQAGGKDRGAPRIGNHPVVGASADNQPSQAVAERRVGSTSLWQRIVQIFTRRTAPQPAPAPAPSPAAAPAPARPESSIAPAARPVVGNPIIIAADPPSPDAAAAGYKTMSVIVGKTPQRVYARN
ncbi:MAG: hypothetical protein LBF25_01745, partial [Puniceicoccales bacterium]|nr:hypothetical protein [Puniceicoccales bacterium]